MMARALTAVLVLLAAPLGLLPASLLHVHDYGDHAHGAHRHRPALHAHVATRPHTHDDGQAGGRAPVRLEACAPSAHMVSVAAATLAPDSPPPLSALTPATAMAGRPAQAVSRIRASDERAHGPPPRRCTSPRAPPVYPAA